jgi:hypothetical protein
MSSGCGRRAPRKFARAANGLIAECSQRGTVRQYGEMAFQWKKYFACIKLLRA